MLACLALCRIVSNPIICKGKQSPKAICEVFAQFEALVVCDVGDKTGAIGVAVNS